MHLILLVFALALFAIASWQHASPIWPRLISAGLALLTASFIQWPL